MSALQEFLSAQVAQNIRVKAIPNVFAQQQGVKPPVGSYQLDNFGALTSWNDIMKQLEQSPDQRLLIMVRHGQAWENLNPTPNSNCEFALNGEVIQNFDSPLSPEGLQQAQALNELFRSPASNETNKTWYETIGLTQESTNYITSPLTRTLQTTQGVFDQLPLSKSTGGAFIAHELIRATLGVDVCNFRHNVNTSTASTVLPYPWQTGCALPTDSLQAIYASSAVAFSFPIRPAGGTGFGMVSDYDQLWRADVADEKVINTRASAFLAQVYEYTAPSSVTAVVTHGEMISAIYQAAGEAAYDAKNTEVVPLLLKFN